APDVPGAVRRSLTFLEKGAVAWKEERHCASCHHVPMTIWSLNEARARGYAVNDKALAELTSWTLAADDPGKVFNTRPPQADKPVNLAVILVSLAVESGGPADGPAREGLQKLLADLGGQQADEGNWNPQTGGRPPMFASREVTTALTLLALTAAQLPADDKGAKAAAEKGLKWLDAAAPEDDLQATALRLILGQRVGKPKEAL